MTLFNAAKLYEYLAHYGADVETWPEDIRPLGRWALLHHPEFAALIDAEQRFENLLRERRFMPARPGLAERIIAAAHAREAQTVRPLAWLSDMLADVKSAALAAMLVLGFAIGFGTLALAPLSKTETQQAYADDDGTLL